MQLLPIPDSQQQLWQPMADEFLAGLKVAAENAQEGLYKAVCAMLKSPIKAAVDQKNLDEQHWLLSAYDDLQAQYLLPAWPALYECEDVTAWSDFKKSALKVWLYCKMQAEEHGTCLHSSECDRQFTETDRLVKSLLMFEAFSEEESNGPMQTKPGTA